MSIDDKQIIKQASDAAQLKKLQKEASKYRRDEIRQRRSSVIKKVTNRYRDNKAYGEYMHHRHLEDAENERRKMEQLQFNRLRDEYLADRLEFLRRRFIRDDQMEPTEALTAAKLYIEVNAVNEQAAADTYAHERINALNESRQRRNRKALVKKYGKEKADQLMKEADPFSESPGTP